MQIKKSLYSSLLLPGSFLNSIYPVTSVLGFFPVPDFPKLVYRELTYNMLLNTKCVHHKLLNYE